MKLVDTNISRLLLSHFFLIPRFQRPYSWEQEHLEDFWGDILETGEPNYFLGSMIGFESDGATVNLVDGQQRLATIALSLAAIRDCFAAEGFSGEAQGIQAYLEKPDIRAMKRFVLAMDDAGDAFHTKILAFPQASLAEEDAETEASTKAVIDAFAYMKARFVAQVEKVRKSRPTAKQQQAQIKAYLEESRDTLLALRVIWIEEGDEDSAYILFETLNTRGKDLTTSDMIKSHLLKLAKANNKANDQPRTQWNKLAATIENSETGATLDSFIHHYWLSAEETVAAKLLYRRVKAKITNDTSARNLLRTFVGEANRYIEIQDTSTIEWANEERAVEVSLESLSDWDIQQHLAFVLAAYREYRTGKIKVGHLISALWAIECFHFAYSIAAKHASGNLASMYGVFGRKLVDAKDMTKKVRAIEELKKKLNGMMPTDAAFKSGFQKLQYSNEFAKQKKFVQYGLGKIQSRKARGAVLDVSVMTIEHLAAQASASVPKRAIAEIGNLLLVDEDTNGKLGNKPTAAKLPILKGLHLDLGPTLKNAVKWDEDEIHARSKELAEEAVKLWKF